MARQVKVLATQAWPPVWSPELTSKAWCDGVHLISALIMWVRVINRNISLAGVNCAAEMRGPTSQQGGRRDSWKVFSDFLVNINKLYIYIYIYTVSTAFRHTHLAVQLSASTPIPSHYPRLKLICSMRTPHILRGPGLVVPFCSVGLALVVSLPGYLVFGFMHLTCFQGQFCCSWFESFIPF